jgi:OOP family OmpA-OmpF porin
MNKSMIVVFAFLAVFNSPLIAQDKKIKKPSFGFQFSFIDFPTASELRTQSLSKVIDSNQWSNTGRMDPALTLIYAQGLHSKVDFMSRLTSSFVRYPFRNKTASSTKDKFYAEIDATVNLKLLSDKYIIVPYLQAGIGAAYAEETFMAQTPLGAGLQIKIAKNNFINLNTSYRLPVTAPANYSLMHSIGVVSSIANEKPVAPKPLPPAPKPVPPADGDGDGVIDSLDACPDAAGLADLKGCPDSDKDGIADKEDKCPNEAGIPKYGGCPIPDTDKDGINDEVDKCPNEPGFERYEGCPIPDTDKDGVNDEEDKCPAVAGTPEEMGCTPVDYKSDNMLFALGRSVLNAKSKKTLNLLAKFLNENTDVKVYLGGHSDSTGTEERNTTLSLERAQKASAYLTSKGIAAERISTQGYAASRPVADNKTSKGRTKNRRVEVSLKRY